MNGADYIAEFLAQRGCDKAFVLTGGACAFILDAIARHPKVDYVCFQHEQAAAMAADAVWRVAGKVGVSVATSGPGATNLLTGIASSYFDSIPSLHITGQVNMRESAAYLGAKPRQAGFQETKIVEMARPITKYAVQVANGAELRRELAKCYAIATSGRMGPVLIDVPMNVQQEEVGDVVEYEPPQGSPADEAATAKVAVAVDELFATAERPLVLLGAGVGLAGAQDATARWLEERRLPFVASWNGVTYFRHDHPGYCGEIGVYGNRGANSILQNCDALLVLGSRLDNRQRSGNTKTFVPGARVLALDIDAEELGKYAGDGYRTAALDFAHLPAVLRAARTTRGSAAWTDYIASMRRAYLGRDISTFAREHGTVSPYEIVRRINATIADDAIVIADTGATVCWVFQTFHRARHMLFTSGGNSPMGYALPAAIGAALVCPDRQVVCITGDGGFQLNLPELQTLRQLGLNITVIVMNNHGYGIIRQFQDSYLESRHEASSRGYGQPDFRAIAGAYGIAYHRIDRAEQLTSEVLRPNASALIDVRLAENTLIEPKLEMGRPINDQFPYASDAEFARNNPFVRFSRPGSGAATT